MTRWSGPGGILAAATVTLLPTAGLAARFFIACGALQVVYGPMLLWPGRLVRLAEERRSG